MKQQKATETGSDLVKSDGENTSGNFYAGTEAFFGVFTQCQVYLSGVRLVHDGKVTQQVSDLASQVENNRRRFLHSGDVSFALQEMTRITNSYNHRIQAWESEASRRERNKKTMSGGALAKMKSELSMVRTQTRLASRVLTKLEVELHQIAGRESFDAKQQPTENADADQAGLASNSDSDAPVENQQPVLSVADQAKAVECVRNVDLFIKGAVGNSLLVAHEKANREVDGDPDRMEQVWDIQTDSKTPIFLVVGWTVKHPRNTDGMAVERKKLDLCFWLVPKSLAASDALRFVDEKIEIWISSRKLDSTRLTFRIAGEHEFPRSALISGFLNKFTTKYDDRSPTLLVAHFHNLEWTQKTVIASSTEKQG